MRNYLTALAELFKLSTMYADKRATANLAKLLELSTEPTRAIAHWNSIKGDLRTIADTIVLQDVSEFLEKGVRQ